MSTWKKIIVSGSGAHLSSVTASNGSIISGSLTMSGSITNVDNLDFNTTPPASLDASITGRLSWNSGVRDLTMGVGNNVEVSLGQSEWAYVYNAEGTTLNKGEVVYVSGSQGNVIAVKRASDASDGSTAGTLGVVGESIAAGGNGVIITNGLLKKLNTIGLTEGSLLYVGTTPGTYTQTKPISPKHEVRVGYVVRVHATVGEIYVKVDNGYEIGELHDVIDTTTTASYGDLLIKSGSVWTNSKQLSGSYGITGSLQATSLTGSLQGSSSYAIQSLSSSYSITASFASSSPAVYDFGSFATPTDVGGGGNFGILTDGDKGDITVTSSGSIWTIDNDVVTYDKIQNVTTSSVLLGRATAGAGDIEEIILGSGLTLAGTTLSATGVGGGGLGAPTYVVTKTADETITSSTTLQDDDHLFQALTSGKSYWIELKLLLTRTDTVNSVNGNYVIDGNSEGYMAGSTLMNNSTTLSFGGLGGIGIAGLPLRRYEQGTLKLTTNYTLKFRWAQAASSTTGVTVMKGSQLLIWEF